MQNTTVHVLLGLIFASAMLALTALEVIYVHITDTSLLFIVIQNIGLGFANSYYAGQIQLSESGLAEKTTSTSS